MTLYVTKLDDKTINTKGKSSFNYKYIIERGACAHTAFRTDKEFNQWIGERGLLLEKPFINDPSKLETSIIKNDYKEKAHFIEDDFYNLDYIIKSRTLSNGDMVEAIITEDENKIRTVHTLNPNVKNRKTFARI